MSLFPLDIGLDEGLLLCMGIALVGIEADPDNKWFPLILRPLRFLRTKGGSTKSSSSESSINPTWNCAAFSAFEFLNKGNDMTSSFKQITPSPASGFL
jgi:hypothetical protein